MEQGHTERTAATDPDRDCGILLGWKFDPVGERVKLGMQSARETWNTHNAVREFKYFMSKERAVLLGNYLYGSAGETFMVRRKPGFCARLFP